MSDSDWLWLVAIISGPTVLVLLAAILRGYSIKIWRDHPGAIIRPRKRKADDDE